MSGTRRRRVGGAIATGLLAGLLIAASSAAATTVHVANTDDAGAGSLRQALANATDGDVLILPAGTYQVKSAQLTVADAVTIRGAGARKTTLKADGNNRVIRINSALSAPTTISDLTVTGGKVTGINGGGIRADSDFALLGVAVIGNEAGTGGGNYDYGGGVYALSVDATFRDSLFAANAAFNGGGAALQGAGTLTVVNSTFSGNSAGQSSPSAGDGYGGGLYADGVTNATIRNSTIADNRDFSAGDGDAEGGAGYASYTSNPTAVANTIIAGNSAFVDNGEVPGSPGNPVVNKQCNNFAPNTDLGHNIDGSTTCNFNDPTSLQNTGAKLADLADNGGQTDTMALLPGSRARNKGADCEATDQRGVPRSLGGACDIGAYERVRCGGVLVNRVGTAARDKLIGTSRADGILALGGKDLLKGLAGNDALCGGGGADKLLGGKGRDKLIGGKGRDRLRGGPGRDKLRGGLGRDRQVQ